MKTKILIFGASGMLGNTLLRYFSTKGGFEVFATIRTDGVQFNVGDKKYYRLFENLDVNKLDDLVRIFDEAQPHVVVNCVGIVKQLPEAHNPVLSIALNSLLPHRLAQLCASKNSRLIHISTDCVFSGAKGGYIETDTPDALDLYGRSKLLGEVEYPHTITLRTSMIGHELIGARSLINWFLAQEGNVRGFTKAIFSGLPTIEISRVIETHVLPNPKLNGLYHLSVDPISKYDLLMIVKDVYEKQIDIDTDDSIVINRSLDSTRFRQATGFSPKPWPELIRAMHDFG